MTQENIISNQQPALVAASKWGENISPNKSTRKVALGFLETRLRTVLYWLPLAAERSGEEAEYVHQLRVSSRRALAALRVFADLMSKQSSREMRAQVRKIRVAANGARNWDVFADLFLNNAEFTDAGFSGALGEQIRIRRNEVQQPIRGVYREPRAEKFDRRIEDLLEEVSARRNKQGKRRYARQARKYLQKPLKKFFQAFAADLSDDAALHNLRLCTKKLRYTMEIVAGAFEPTFRQRLYPRIGLLQTLMGTANDHAMATTICREWLLNDRNMEERRFLEGFLLAETRAQQDLRQTFLTIWTPKEVDKLRRRFRLYCGLP